MIRLLLLFLLAIAPAFGRTFTNQDGRMIEGTIGGVSEDGKEVSIYRDEDFKRFVIPVSTFVASDQEFIKSWAKSHPMVSDFEVTVSRDRFFQQKEKARYNFVFTNFGEREIADLRMQYTIYDESFCTAETNMVISAVGPQSERRFGTRPIPLPLEEPKGMDVLRLIGKPRDETKKDLLAIWIKFFHKGELVKEVIKFEKKGYDADDLDWHMRPPSP